MSNISDSIMRCAKAHKEQGPILDRLNIALTNVLKSNLISHEDKVKQYLETVDTILSIETDLLNETELLKLAILKEPTSEEFTSEQRMKIMRMTLAQNANHADNIKRLNLIKSDWNK